MDIFIFLNLEELLMLILKVLASACTGLVMMCTISRVLDLLTCFIMVSLLRCWAAMNLSLENSSLLISIINPQELSLPRTSGSQYQPTLVSMQEEGMARGISSMSWRHKDGMTESFDAYEPEVWSPCTQPGHQACLNNFPIQGNMQLLWENYP